MPKVNSIVLFFILVFVLYFLTVQVARYLISEKDFNHNTAYMLSGMLYTLLILFAYRVAKVGGTSEGFWDVSDYAQCKGGPYFWQGDSPTAKRCRELASTPEGRCGISSYNCTTGYVGTPKLPFYYTPLSDDEWKNEQCDDKPTCPCKDVGLCGMEKQVE